MRSEDGQTADAAGLGRHRMITMHPRRPWALIVAALLLAVLSVVLWMKWRESRTRAEQLQAELQQVYAETESLRTQAIRAQQLVTQLEHNLRSLAAGEGTSKAAVGTKPRHAR
jgi:membrane protein implicated in regulation of membrane protease activity